MSCQPDDILSNEAFPLFRRLRGWSYVLVVGLVQKAFADHFEEHASNLGASSFGMICKRLKYEGLDIGTHAEEIFDTSLSNALKHLKKHGGASVAYPNSWFKAIVRNETTRYLRQMHSSHLVWLEDVLAGGEIITQPSEEIDSDREAVMDLVRDGIEKLTPRQRELILYDLADRFTPSEIQDKMGIRSKGYFRKLKCEAFKALREAVKALIDEGVDLIF